jgi:hypothetical protein
MASDDAAHLSPSAALRELAQATPKAKKVDSESLATPSAKEYSLGLHLGILVNVVNTALQRLSYFRPMKFSQWSTHPLLPWLPVPLSLVLAPTLMLYWISLNWVTTSCCTCTNWSPPFGVAIGKRLYEPPLGI